MPPEPELPDVFNLEAADRGVVRSGNIQVCPDLEASPVARVEPVLEGRFLRQLRHELNHGVVGIDLESPSQAVIDLVRIFLDRDIEGPGLWLEVAWLMKPDVSQGVHAGLPTNDQDRKVIVREAGGRKELRPVHRH